MRRCGGRDRHRRRQRCRRAEPVVLQGFYHQKRVIRGPGHVISGPAAWPAPGRIVGRHLNAAPLVNLLVLNVSGTSHRRMDLRRLVGLQALDISHTSVCFLGRLPPCMQHLSVQGSPVAYISLGELGNLKNTLRRCNKSGLRCGGFTSCRYDNLAAGCCWR